MTARDQLQVLVNEELTLEPLLAGPREPGLLACRVASGFSVSSLSHEEMIEEATVDCYNESEQVTGWLTMIDENLAVPFETTVLGVAVTVERVDLDRSEHIVAVCSRGRDRQSIPILDLPLPTPPPDGAEWLEAYRQWRGEG